MMDDLLADFVAETREMLEASGGEIVAWEADPSDKTRLDTIFRFVHTVKGNCGFFDFPRLEQLSHAAEDALAECRANRREPDGALVSAVLAIIDRIGEMADAIEAGEDYPEGGDDELIAALQPDSAGERAVAAPIASTDGAEATEQFPRASRTPAVQRSIRLPTELLDEVMKGVSDMVLARNDLARRLREVDQQPTIDGPFERLSTILADVRTAITRMRMQRLEHLFGTFPRLVRDLSNELGKQVMVDFEGSEVELDREMVEMVRDPLTHIIRNAIDHGLEGPGERLKAGKREIGLLKFAARQSGNQITLAITDDGRGIDTDRLAAKAIAADLYSEAQIAEMSERRRLHLIFEPGLSTADKVSSVSGRGVGMDVVRSNIEKVGGSIDVVSKPGEGTSFHLKLPLTLSIIAALTIGYDGQRYAIPRSYVEEIVLGSSDHLDFAEAGERRLVSFRGERVPCLSLDEILGGRPADAIEWHRKTLVLVRLATDDIFALAVDRVFDHEDVVVKPVAPAIMATGLYAGTTLLDDGRPMMLLDLPSIAQARHLVNEIRNASRLIDEEGPGEERKAPPVMLFTTLDGRRRAIRLELVRRIDTVPREAIDIEGTRAQAVIEGAILPLIGYSCGPLPDGNCRLLRLSDGETEIVHAVREVLDATALTGAIVPSNDEAGLEGVTLIDGHLVPVLDGHALFADHGAPGRTGAILSCRLPDDNDWARTILEPLLEAAGYRIASSADEEVDVAIELGESEAECSAGRARKVIRLRPEPHSAQDDPDSIYRYDRAALLTALRQIRPGKTA